MGYLNVTWTTSAPAVSRMSWGNAAFLCSGNKPDGTSNPQIVTSSNYSDLIPDTRWEYKALQSYFANMAGRPTNDTYLYWMGQGSGITGIAQGTGLEYYIKYPPYDSIDTVQVDPTGGTNWQAIASFNISTCPSGYVAETGDYGKYNGYVTFSGVMDGDVDDGGPYFDSGGATYSGTLARDIMHASGGRIRVLATRNGFGVAAQKLIPEDIQFICPAYDVTAGETGIMGDSTGSVEDLQNCLGMCAGNSMMTVWALPTSAEVNATYPDASVSQEAQNLRDYVGQDKNAILIYADVATGSNGTGLDDPAACYLGKIVDTHPHTTLTLADLNISLNSRTDDNDKAAWDAGNIACIFRKSELGFSTDQISYGFTLSGTTPENRLNNVRCKYLVQSNVLQDLWSLISSRNVRINKAGLGKVTDTINATLNRLESQGIIDAGDRQVEIPLANGTSAEWTSARQTRIIPSIIVRWSWHTSPEQLNINQFGEIL